MKKKSKNKISFPNLILVIVGIAVIIFSVYSVTSLTLINDNKASVLNTLENEYYVVGKEPTDYQKEVFEELSDELNEPDRNYKEISELVAKSFVIDFFGLSNKDSAYDIGGLQYIYDPEKFHKIAHWEYYQKLDVFNTTYGKGKMPVVKNVIASTNKIQPYKVNEKLLDAYQVDLKWSYNHDTNLNINKFIDNAELILVEDQGKVVIVEIKMIEEDDSLDESTLNEDESLMEDDIENDEVQYDE